MSKPEPAKDHKFVLSTEMKPAGDQPKAIKHVTAKLLKGERLQTIVGATGTGKTFVMANIIQNIQKPTLIIAHNKTLAAQLCSEFKELFPNNAVNYFVSYYDYYQPEAYMPTTDTYIKKDASINEEIDKYRHAATRNLLTRPDTIIVSSVSCIYGLGPVEEYKKMNIDIAVGQKIGRQDVMKKLVAVQYIRNDLSFPRGTYRARGDVLEVSPPYDDYAVRIEFFGDEVERITITDPMTGEFLEELENTIIYPAKHAVTDKAKIAAAIESIKTDMEEQVKFFEKDNRAIEAQRIRERTMYDIELLTETGYCSGIENYSSYLDKRKDGTPPSCLMDYFPDDFLMFVDESHMTIPQINGMFGGDFSRKKTLVHHGFRLPSCHNNRPLKFNEFEDFMQQAVFVSATPGKYEGENTDDSVELIIRPTGLLDPVIEVRPLANQVSDVLAEIRRTIKKDQRCLVTTLTKKMSEELTEFLEGEGIKVSYLHSEIDTFQRIEIIRDLRLGVIDVIVGINLLREGLDMPEVSFIGILDADKEGFLRSGHSLIQTIGRAARNSDGHVFMYGDRVTDSMKIAIDSTSRRRKIQEAHNKKHGITPKTIIKKILDIHTTERKDLMKKYEGIKKTEIAITIAKLEIEMDESIASLNFEIAAELRDEIELLKKKEK